MAVNFLEQYVTRYGDQTFAQRPLNEIDGAILALLASMNFGALPAAPHRELADLADDQASQQTLLTTTWSLTFFGGLLRAMITSVRYRHIRWLHYREKFNTVAAQQFAAVTFALTPGHYYVAFRGTDASIAGWKEDFNMIYLSEIPSQRSAVAYFQEVYASHPGRYYLGGHSKGGNLAVYTALHAAQTVARHIARVFNLDGPGFLPSLHLEKRYRAMRARITKIVPQESIFGLVLENHHDYAVVASTRRAAVDQHDPFSWRIYGRRFVSCAETGRFSRFVQKTVTGFLHNMSRIERSIFLASLYGVADAAHAQTMGELMQLSPHRLRTFYRAAKAMPDTMKAQWKTAAGHFWHALGATPRLPFS